MLLISYIYSWLIHSYNHEYELRVRGRWDDRGLGLCVCPVLPFTQKPRPRLVKYISGLRMGEEWAGGREKLEIRLVRAFHMLFVCRRWGMDG